MNKKLNTLLFILCATLFNVLVTVFCFALFSFLYIKFIMPLLPEANRYWGFALIFIASIVASFLVYRAIIKYLTNKVDVERYFDQIFGKKRG
ncbi:MAG: leader peptide processing enzyme [Treponema sp.]|jgi:membrane protein implicated in regulation of membrane protease activity|nr:leader peptide processing enzyme [Treponema sp.]